MCPILPNPACPILPILFSRSRAGLLDQHALPDLHVTHLAVVLAAHGDRLAFAEPPNPGLVRLGRGLEKALDLELGVLVTGVQDDEGRVIPALAHALHDPGYLQVLASVLVVG